MAASSLFFLRMWNIKGISGEQDPLGVNEIKLVL